MRRLGVLCALAATAACLWGATTASAGSFATRLTSTNGFGSFDDTITCANGGDGPSWRYGYTGAATPLSGTLGGLWSGTLEVHRSTVTGGFMPGGTGRVAIDAGDRGGLFLEFSGGSCTTTPLTLSNGGDEPTVSGALPFQITGGIGAYRLVTGSGTAALTAQLTKGADNAAQIDLSGTVTALQPNLTVSAASARWPRIADWLGRNIAVGVTVTNSGPSSTTGDAFDVDLVSATVSGAGPASHPPKITRLNAGQSAGVGFTVSNVNPGATYSITLTFASKDAFGGAAAPVVVTRTFKAPLTPLNII
jgi:hypothetical protein